MAALDLTHLTDNIKKTKNWSIHRKRMYAMGLMHELYITDGSLMLSIPLFLQVIDY
ncbi:hypothetical protein RI092_07180 [Lactococcus cremoris]|uniref:hypothetical protein n=1 Tax=Lactococcus lactis subsp. cremoris TaxID=1359 RepID=UPI002872A405|nr:hypothetical protein [Lactococcus cremoris]MDR9867600.1 hypothetical protein [Lactococcus cremoris]